MKLNLKKVGDYYIINLHKFVFQRQYVNDLKNLIDNIISQDGKNIVIDLSELDRIDGVGFGVFLSIQKMSLFHNVKIRLSGLRPHILQTFEQTLLSTVLDICQKEKDYLSSEIFKKSALVA